MLHRTKALIVLFSLATVLFAIDGVSAQDDEILLPEQSAAKAKQVIDQAIQALGGPAYLNVHDVTCTVRLGQFGHSGDLNGFGDFVDYAMPPDKERTENLPQRNIIEVHNGDKGWDLDRGGVSEAPETDLAHRSAEQKVDIDNILRRRIHEPGMIFRYAGEDVVDLRDADWVELVDQDNRTIRIAISRADHLPIREVVETRDPNTNTKTTEIDYYSNFHPIDGIQTMFQMTRERNGIKMDQIFFDKCQYNTGLSESLFTKESLDERWQKIGKKPKEKKNKYAAGQDQSLTQ